mmetsp:Transcript_47642/g.101246  ORF Transcript_47642/g.101246 Transcript_47642/m.101246 type:complete len:662 (-) Transcript_47642:30-2015(-)
MSLWDNSSQLENEGPRFQHDVKAGFNPPTDLPVLPGFRPSNLPRPSSAKSQSLSFVNGYMMAQSPLPARHLPHQVIQSLPGSRPMTAPICVEKEVLDPTDVSGRYSFFRKKTDRENCNIALPFCPESKLPSFLEHDRRVLLFNAYYEEDVLQSAIEEKRIHTCEVYFYVEDGTMEIIQTKQENSGIVQGRFLRRSRVAKPGSSSYYEIDDLKIGSQVVIYSRTFHIASCNESTRDYVVKYHEWNEEDVDILPLPRDRFAESNKAKMRRESGVPGVDRKRKMNDLKQVMESMLGKESSMTDRGMFLECGTDSLCFHVLWDDRERLYGDIQYFLLFYYLADDTVEIMRTNSKNDGRDSFPKLLKRSKLPKNGRVSDSDCYTWKDLGIGETVNVFGRTMIIARSDAFTRQYYLSNGITLRDDMPLQLAEKKVEVKRVIPPYNGFGTEEDSLRSCTGGLNPPPAKKDLQKMRDKSGVILRFNAQLVSDRADDATRRFVIQFFMEDDTISIREPPVKNSGVMGGSFLRRQTMKHENGSYYAAKDMYVGNIVDIVGHQFLLLNADEYTYRLMECDDRTFPFSNFARLHGILTSKHNEIKSYFISNYEGTGIIDQDGLAKCCRSLGLHLNTQELLTIWRKLDKKGKGNVAFTKLLKLAASEDAFGSQR